MSKFRDLSMKSKIILVVSLVVVACLILAVGVYWYIGSKLFSRLYKPDIVISSPDGQYELVIREYSCIGGVGAEIYIREPGQDKWYNSWKMKEIGSGGADDYYLTFTNGTYYVEWESDKVTIYYYMDLLVENVNDRSTWRGVLSYEFE